MKVKRRLIALVLPALWIAPALAQPAVFFDDFDGNALAPHWSLPAPSSWEYNVSDSMLNVTGLFSPSNPKSPTNFTGMSTTFAPQNDLQLDARMGWGASEGIARFEVIIRINSGNVARFGYREHDVGGQPGIFAGTDAGVVTIPSPPPGIYDFRMTRVGTVFNFYFEGNLFASLPSAYNGPLNGIGIFFSSPFPGPSGPFHMDSLQVVPAPSTLFALSSALMFIFARRRGRWREAIR